MFGVQLLSDLFQLELMLYTPRFKTTCERVSSFTRDLSSRRDWKNRLRRKGIKRPWDSKWTPLLGGGKDKDGDSLKYLGRAKIKGSLGLDQESEKGGGSTHS